MKYKISIAFFLIISNICIGQQLQYVPAGGSPTTIAQYQGGVMGKLYLILPKKDTLNNPATFIPGAMTIRPQDTVGHPTNTPIYMSNGVFWTRVNTPFIIPIGIDSVTLYGNQLCQWQGGTATCYFLQPSSGGAVDSFHLSPDSLAIYQYRNGMFIDSIYLLHTYLYVDNRHFSLTVPYLGNPYAQLLNATGLVDSVYASPFGGGFNYIRYGNGNIDSIPAGGSSTVAIQWSVLDSLSTPSVTPSDGGKYLVGTSPTGAFTGHANEIATYNFSGLNYTFQSPTVGDLLYNAGNTLVSQWTGTTWIRVSKLLWHQGGEDASYGNVVGGSKGDFSTILKTRDTTRLEISNTGVNTFANGIVNGNYIKIDPESAGLSPNIRMRFQGALEMSIGANSLGSRIATNVGLDANGVLRSVGLISASTVLAGNPFTLNPAGGSLILMPTGAPAFINFTNNTAFNSGALGTQTATGDLTYYTTPTSTQNFDGTEAWRTVRSTNDFLIGTPTDVTNSLLTVKSTSKGVLFTPMTAAQRLAIGTPAIGLMVFDTDSACYFNYTGSAWVSLCRTGSGGSGSSLANFYLKDSTLSSERTVDLGGFPLHFVNSGNWLNIDPSAGFEKIELNVLGSESGASTSLTLNNNSDNGNKFNLSAQSATENVGITGNADAQTFSVSAGGYNPISIDIPHDTMALRIIHASGAESLIRIGDDGSPPKVTIGLSDLPNGQTAEYLFQAGGANLSINSATADQRNVSYSINSGGIQEIYQSTATSSTMSRIVGINTGDHPYTEITSTGVTSGQTGQLIVTDTSININTPILRVNGVEYSAGSSGTITDVTATTPINSSGGTTPNITIDNAAADGSTKGAASFTAADFNSSSGNISIDYPNGQGSDASHKGYLTSSDWSAFNSKQAALSGTGLLSFSGTTPAYNTTSASIAGIISDEVGTDKMVFNTSPTLVTPVLGVASATSLSNAGTGGAGFLQVANQSSAPSTPTTSGRLFWDASNRFSWIGTNGFVRTFDGTANTADRIYVLPDAAGTVALTSNLSSYLPLAGGTMVGNIIATDNTYDLGASGATRFRTAYLGTSLMVPAINGGSAANDDITIQGTTNATRTTSYVNLQPTAGFVGIGTTTPADYLNIALASGEAGITIQQSGATDAGAMFTLKNTSSNKSFSLEMASNSFFGTPYTNTGMFSTIGADMAFITDANSGTGGTNTIRFGTGGSASGQIAMTIDASQRVGVGLTSPTSKLHTTSFATAVRQISALRTLDITDDIIECTSGTFTVTLPTAVGITGREYWVTNTGAGTITVATTSSQTFPNVTTAPTTITIAQFTNYRFVSNGTGYLAYKIVN